MRRSTREIALAAEQASTLHAASEIAFHERIERTLSEGRQDRQRMHDENKQLIAELSKNTDDKIEAVHERINGIVWKIVSWQAALIMAAASAIAALLGVPSLHH